MHHTPSWHTEVRNSMLLSTNLCNGCPCGNLSFKRLHASEKVCLKNALNKARDAVKELPMQNESMCWKWLDFLILRPLCLGLCRDATNRRNEHVQQVHPHRAFPVDRLEAAVKAIPLESFPVVERELAAFGCSHRYRCEPKPYTISNWTYLVLVIASQLGCSHCSCFTDPVSCNECLNALFTLVAQRTAHPMFCYWSSSSGCNRLSCTSFMHE